MSIFTAIETTYNDASSWLLDTALPTLKDIRTRTWYKTAMQMTKAFVGGFVSGIQMNLSLFTAIFVIINFSILTALGVAVLTCLSASLAYASFKTFAWAIK